MRTPVEPLANPPVLPPRRPAPSAPVRRPSGRWAGFAARIEAATPPDRARAIDGLRALAILGVIVGHFLVLALTVDPGRALRVTSPLISLPAFAPLSWVLQMLGLFFLVGGYAAAKSRERGGGYRAWVSRRMRRLIRPVVVVATALGAALPLLALAGVPAGTLRTTVVLVVQPLWFIGIYALITALTPVAIALTRRLGAWAALLGFVIVAGVDLLRYGPWHDAVPGWIGLVNLLPGWSFAYLLGVAWAHGRIGRRGAVLLAVAGGVVMVLLVRYLGYPASMVGVPGTGRTNAHPPSLLVLALAAVQCGLAIVLHDRLAALLARRPGLWAVVAVANLSAMTIFCWHQVALMTLSGGALAVAAGGLPGLHDAPVDLAWVAHRLAWLPVYGAVLAAYVVAARRFEMPRSGRGAARGG
ncbi:MAG TPA: acyltransferase [Streptosporangiaceae bacterium]|nr:acyltransferase [Streptosporangiaceae bacterium]